MYNFHDSISAFACSISCNGSELLKFPMQTLEFKQLFTNCSTNIVEVCLPSCALQIWWAARRQQLQHNGTVWPVVYRSREVAEFGGYYCAPHDSLAKCFAWFAIQPWSLPRICLQWKRDPVCLPNTMSGAKYLPNLFRSILNIGRNRSTCSPID